MHACLHACMYAQVGRSACTHACMHERMHVCMFTCGGCSQFVFPDLREEVYWFNVFFREAFAERILTCRSTWIPKLSDLVAYIRLYMGVSSI